MARNFALDISKFIAKSEKKAEAVVKKVALDLFTSVVLKTPVDTGAARGNWSVSLGVQNVPVADKNRTDKTGASTIGAIAAGVDQYKLSIQNLYLSNNLPYIIALEEGTGSKQAPNGMVRLAIQEFQDYVARSVAEEK